MESSYSLITGDASLLYDKGGWSIRELSLPEISGLPLARKQDALGAFTSGDLTSPQGMHGKAAIAGLDLLAIEQNPRRKEPDVNVYHYILVRTGRTDIPLILYGPFEEGTIIGHWPDTLDLISGYYH